MTHAATAPHETAGNLIFTDRGLRPYRAISTLHANGFDESSDEIEMAIDGESWTISLTAQKSGIAPRPEDDVGGNRLSEFRIAASGRGERKAHYHIQPRFPGMYHYETGEPISTPFDHIGGIEGLNVRFSGSNLEPDEYRDLLPRFVRWLVQETEVAIDPAQFTGPVHEMSNIFAHERYLRIDRDWSAKVVGPNGALERLMRLCASRIGGKCEYRADDDGIVGYNHRLVLPEADAERVLSGHEYGKQIKHYHPKHVRRLSRGDPLAHPKLCVLVKSSLNNGAVAWKYRASLRREIDETLVNLLYWSDVPVHADGTTYVADPHFQAETAAEPVELVANPLPTFETRQELLLAKVTRDMCTSDLEVLERLVADGSGQHPAALARKTGHGKSTIYRSLRRLSGIVETEAGSVSFASKKFEQELAGVVEGPEYGISDPVERAAHILDLDQSDSGSSAWQQWCRTYAGKLTETTNGSNADLRIDTVLSRLKSSSNPRLQEVLREAIRAWRADGHDPLELRRAATKWRSASDKWERGNVNALLR